MKTGRVQRVRGGTKRESGKRLPRECYSAGKIPARPSAIDRAKALVDGRWAAKWGEAELHGWAESRSALDRPGAVARLSLAEDVADVIVIAESAARHHVLTRILRLVEVDLRIRAADRNRAGLPCRCADSLAPALRKLIAKEGL